MGAAVQKLPKIDFTGVELGTEGWAAVRAEVMEALGTYGCFEAVYPQVSSELREALLGVSLKDLFALPLDTKLANTSNKPYHGYLGQIPYLAYESLAIHDPVRPEAVHAFASLMWPEGGNPSFCETVGAFSKAVAGLDEMIRRMVLESLGVEKYLEPHMKSTPLQLRVAEYGASPHSRLGGGGGDGGAPEERKMGLVPHRDKNTFAIVCQNEVDGLEMETPDGVWLPAVPSSDSFIVMAGDSLRAWTNGRVYSPLHRILVGSNETRYSAILFAIPEDDMVIQAPPELVDEEHPALFKPYEYASYVRFCSTEEGIKAKCQLDAYCGITPAPDQLQEQEEAATQA